MSPDEHSYRHTVVEQELGLLRVAQQLRRPQKRSVRRRKEKLERLKQAYLSGQQTVMKLVDILHISAIVITVVVVVVH